ncbi:BZ3500_MvSof-1268-A1-R1_Chr6-3g08678 [Microbotryum saponariae]|uniref:BZ3500_MvSof-1268-A1-R1_Chr6-3g08678 protein n=1 Tax=Microbotryum saponariae TaxID=289078 RepID=A0A2X0LMT4_9BASI|nr:BZ3500_MvSof-1268-A1-R1_Chr6-3g08678 [Microbotryum saponariae]SDA07279.1 BZ3501_MvSof-1269-A2-R1_Chr6-2g08381 [Microbotryum saponariae]
MGLLNFPPPPSSSLDSPSAVSEVYRIASASELNHVLQLTVPRGASVRFYVLFGLMFSWKLMSLLSLPVLNSGVVSGLAFLIITFFDYQRRAKRMWMFRFVHRPKGRYIVGNQHVVFTTFSIISCLVLIGFAESSRRALILHRGMAEAFYWRNLVYIPILAQGWVSSFSILQASVLGSERALNKQVLSPRVVNLVYIIGIVVILSAALTLDIFIARAWSQAWIQSEALRSLLTTTGTDSTITSASLVARTTSILSKIRTFERTERAVCCLYILGAVCCIFINLAGLSLLLILRRQIRYNSVKFAGEVREDGEAQAQEMLARTPTKKVNLCYPHQDRKMSSASGVSKNTQTTSHSGTTEGSGLSKLSGTTAANSISAQFARRDSGVDPLCKRAELHAPPHITIPMHSPFSSKFYNFDPFSRDNTSHSPPLTPRRDSNADPLSPSSDSEPSSRSMVSDYRRDSALSNCSASTLRPGFERRQSLFHKVIFALAPNEEETNDDPEAKQAENAQEEKAMKMATTARLRAEVEKTEPEGAAQREWARQLLALKRVEWDLSVFIAVIVSLAVVLFCVSLWTAITPSSIYRSAIRIEISLFLFPWIYLTVVAIAHTSLLYNAYMNLTPITPISVPAHHVFLHSARAQLKRESIELLENEFDLDPLAEWKELLGKINAGGGLAILGWGRRFSSASQIEERIKPASSGSPRSANGGEEESEDEDAVEGARGLRR